MVHLDFLSLVGLPAPPCYYETLDLDNAAVTGNEVHMVVGVPDYDGCKMECQGDRECSMGTYHERAGFNLCFLYTREAGVLTFPAVGQSFIKRCDGRFLFSSKKGKGGLGSLS